ncbi:MAG: alpha/beta fold hydrolase [Gemmatimonadales bacterium]
MPATAALAHSVQGTGPAVVLLHGLGSSKADWGPQVAALSAGYRTIAVDLRGHGDSPHPEGRWTLPEFASDVADLLRRLDAAPAHLVGLSLGGMVAFQLLADHPELVRRRSSPPATRLSENVAGQAADLGLASCCPPARAAGRSAAGLPLVSFPKSGAGRAPPAVPRRIRPNDPARTPGPSAPSAGST